jgi:putative transposase
MNTYKRHRFPPDIISYAVWLYYRFNLSHRDIEDLQAERGIIVTREVIRLWCLKFGALYRRHLVGVEHCRNLRISAFAEWSRAVA